MFSEIEREYKKGLQQKRFVAYYWPCATLVVILAIVFALVFGSTAVVALIILTPVIIAKIISTAMSISRNKIDSSLVEDLAYIYVHFEKYQTRLSEA